MSLPLINAPHLTVADGNAIKAKLQEAYDLMVPKSTSLTPDERRKHGRIKEKNKLKVNKVRQYYMSQPALRAPGADYEELEKGQTTRQIWGEIRAMLENMTDLADSSEIPHDKNAFEISGKDYRYTRNQAAEGEPGYEAKYADMKQLWDTGDGDHDASPATNNDGAES